MFVPLSMPFVGYYLEFIAPMQIVDGKTNLPNLMLYIGLLLVTMVAVYGLQFGRQGTDN